MKELRKLRELAGISQVVVAKKTGIDRVRYSMAECGHVTLNDSEQAAIRRLLLRAIEDRRAALTTVLEHSVA